VAKGFQKLGQRSSDKKGTARRHLWFKACGPPGGLFGIDQEVVTLTWPLRQLRFGWPDLRLASAPDRPASGGINP